MSADDTAQVSSKESTATSSESVMDFGAYFQKGLSILQLDEEAIRSVHRDEEALVPAIIFVAVSGVAPGVAQFSIRGMLFGLVIATLLSFVLVGLLNVLAQLFGARGSFLELYRPIGVAATIHWVQVVPLLGLFIGFLAMLYSMVVAGRVLEVVGELPRSKAALVMLLLIGISLFLCLAFLALYGSLVLVQKFLSPFG